MSSQHVSVVVKMIYTDLNVKFYLCSFCLHSAPKHRLSLIGACKKCKHKCSICVGFWIEVLKAVINQVSCSVITMQKSFRNPALHFCISSLLFTRKITFSYLHLMLKSFCKSKCIMGNLEQQPGTIWTIVCAATHIFG